MGTFQGSETFALDPKGRVNIPAKMKKCIPAEAKSTFVVMRGVDKCIAAYPKNIWENKYKPQLNNLNYFDRDHARLMRLMYSSCEDVTLDSIQRLMLPKELIAFAGIEGNVMLIGLDDRIEFWNPDEYTQYLNSFDEEYEDIAQKVMTGNIDNGVKN